MGMLAKPANGELPPLPKGEVTPIPEDGGGGAAAAAEGPAAVAPAASTALLTAETTPWSGDPEEVHLTGARS